MATSGYDNTGGIRREDDVTQSMITGGAVTSGILGVASVVLAILAFYGINPVQFASIATICVGVAFLIEGGAIAARASHLAAAPENRQGSGVVSGGMALDSIAGIAGIVLGVLVLLGYPPLLMLSIAVIVFGAGILIESGALARVNTLVLTRTRALRRGEPPARGAITTAISLDVICGLASLALGILALLGYMPMTLILSALLVLGCVLLLSGAALASAVRNIFSYRTPSVPRG